MEGSGKMYVGLHDAEKDPCSQRRKRRYDVRPNTYPNYALMKISAYHKSRGDKVEWWTPLIASYDRVYSSKVFDFTPGKPLPAGRNDQGRDRVPGYPHKCRAARRG